MAKPKNVPVKSASFAINKKPRAKGAKGPGQVKGKPHAGGK